jgi:hypothetical protein
MYFLFSQDDSYGVPRGALISSDSTSQPIESVTPSSVPSSTTSSYEPPLSSSTTSAYLPPLQSSTTSAYEQPQPSSTTSSHQPPISSSTTSAYEPPISSSTTSEYLPPQSSSTTSYEPPGQSAKLVSTPGFNHTNGLLIMKARQFLKKLLFHCFIKWSSF